MATHDYVIDNSTGANVRADINSVLQAILTNNSSSSAPTTTAAYMWWADTTTGILKIRNSANDDWVELLQLDGTLTLEDGSASTPALAFRDDLNTGIFSSAADTFNVATGGVERMELGATTIFNEDGADVDFRIEGDTEANLFYVDAGNNRIGIGTSSPEATLHETITTAKTNSVEHMLILEHLSSGTTTTGFGTGIRFRGERNNGVMQNIGDIEFEADVNSGSNISCALVFKPALSGVVTERLRIDSSGRLLVGHSSSRNVGTKTGQLQIINTGNDAALSIIQTNNAASAPFLCFGKTRSANVTGSTTVQNGDSLGQILFTGADGTDVDSTGATITAQVDGTPGSNDMPGRLVFSTTADGAATSTERMRINSSGNVGIGTTSPDGILSIKDTTDTYFYIQNDSTGTGSGDGSRIGFTGASSVLRIQNQENSSIALHTNGSEHMRIDSSGHILFGRTAVIDAGRAAAGTLSIGGSASGTSECLVQLKHSSNTNSTSRNYLLVYNDGGVIVGGITATSTATSFNTSSDYRLKENVTAISDGITRLKTLKPYRFNFIADAETTVDGFIAHEVTAVPEAITGTKDEVDSDNNPVYQGIDQSKLVPLLTAALQEAIAKIEVLETKVAALEAA